MRKSNEESTEPPLTAVTSEKPIHRHRGLAEAETRIHWGNSGGCIYYRLCKYRHIRRQPLSELTQLPGAQNKPYSHRKVFEDQQDKAVRWGRHQNCGQAFSKLSYCSPKRPETYLYLSAQKLFHPLTPRAEHTSHVHAEHGLVDLETTLKLQRFTQRVQLTPLPGDAHREAAQTIGVKFK